MNVISEHSISRVNVKLLCQNSYMSEIFKGHNFNPCKLLKVLREQRLICHIVGFSGGRMPVYSNQQVYALISVLGDKIPDFQLGSKLFLARTYLLAKLQGQRPSDHLLQSSVQIVKSSYELACLYNLKNKPDL